MVPRRTRPESQISPASIIFGRPAAHLKIAERPGLSPGQFSVSAQPTEHLELTIGVLTSGQIKEPSAQVLWQTDNQSRHFLLRQ